MCTNNGYSATGGNGLAEANLVLWFAAPIISGVGAALLIVDATADAGQPPPTTVGLRAWPTPDGGRVGVFGSF